MTSEEALSTVGVGESSSDNKVSWPLSPAWLMNWWTFEVLITLLLCRAVFWSGILSDEWGWPLALPAVDDDEEEADEPGDTVAGLTTGPPCPDDPDRDDALCEFESPDWLKLLRLSSFSRVRNPSILMIFLQPTNQNNALKINRPGPMDKHQHTCKTRQKICLKNNFRLAIHIGEEFPV